MIIKQTKNDKINSFEFYFDLFKANIMEKVLRLFCLEDIYVSVYGLLSNYAVIDHCKNITDKSHIIRARKGIFDMAFGLNSGNISLLFSILGKDLDEVMIWSRERDWERYVAEESEFPAFILHRKSDSERICNKFCLDFEPYKNNRVNIFCDSSFADGMKIAKSDLEKICDE